MAVIKISKETAVPSGASIVANTIYLVSVSADASKMEIYMANSTGTALRRIPTDSDIQTLIDASVSGIGSIQVVDDISDRNALSPTENIQVLVIDASGDPTVTSGSATYVYRLSTTSWIKTSEYESLDVTLEWANIQNKPTSTVTQIDLAVTNSHTHSNKTQLDLIGQDSDGDMTYNGSKVANEYTSTSW